MMNDEIMNDGGLRYGDEFVRHKALDCFGDMYLAGGPLLAHFAGERTGHTTNNKLLRKLFSDPGLIQLIGYFMQKLNGRFADFRKLKVKKYLYTNKIRC